MLQYNCKWNSHAANTMNAMHSLREVENFVDVTLVCEGRSLKAHKLVLSTCSSIFHQMFLGNPCTHPIVFLADVKFSTLKVIIDFIYTGEISFEENELEIVLKAAKTLDIKGLTDICREKLLAQAQNTAENGSKGPTTTLYRTPSPRKKRPRTQSSEVRVHFDDSARQDEEGDDANDENGSAGEEEGKPSEEQNVRIRQALRTLCSAKKMKIKEKREVTGDPSDRRTSYVWNFFTPIDNIFALCKTCNKKISRKSSISNLKKHMETRHSNVVLQSLNSLMESKSITESEPSEKEEAAPLSAEQESEQAVCSIEGAVCTVETAVSTVQTVSDVEVATMVPYVVPFDNKKPQVIYYQQEDGGNRGGPYFVSIT